MTTLRSLAAALLARGVISAGWYAILTGAVMLWVGTLLTSARDDDPAALPVALLLALTGVWQLERGLRSEFRRRRQD